MKIKFLFFLNIILLSGSLVGFAQLKPSKVGFKSYTIETKNDTIDFFIKNARGGVNKNLLIHVSGSWPSPLWIETKPCCVTPDVFNYSLIPQDYAYVVISKYGFPFSDKENFTTPKGFWNKNTLDFRVERTNQVIKYIQENLFRPNKLAVVGTSQGTDVVAKLATINKSITHLGFWAGGGLPVLMEFIMFVRKDAIRGKITEEEATQKIDSLLIQFEKMFADPSPKKMWNENSYLSYVSFSEPPVQHLLKLDIPIYHAIGTADENVAIENAYIIPVEFIRNRKKNLTFKHFPNYDHSFIEKSADGNDIDRMDLVTKDFFKWLSKN